MRLNSASRGWRSGLVLIAGCAALVGLYAILGFWVAPGVIRHQAVSQIASRFHRRASLGDVRFNPFTFVLRAKTFSVQDVDGRQMLGFDSLTLRPSPGALLRGVIELAAFELRGPHVRLVVRPNGRLNLLDLVPQASRGRGGPGPAVLVDRLTVRGGRAEIVDLAGGANVSKDLRDLTLDLTHVSTASGKAHYDMKLESESGERVAARGWFSLRPLASDGVVSLADISLVPLMALAREAAPFDLTRGRASASATYRLAQRGGQAALRLDAAEIALKDARLRARGAPEDWVTIPAMKLVDVRVDPAARLATVGRVEVTGLTANAWRERDGSLNLALYAGSPKPPGADAPAGRTTAGDSGWRIAAPDLRVVGAQIAYEERAPNTPVDLTVAPMDLAVTGFAWPLAAPVKVVASATLDQGGQVSAVGTVDLVTLATEMDVKAAHVDLVRFQPYVDQSSGVRMLSGRVSGVGHISYSQAGGATFAGGASVEDLHTIDRFLRQDFINWSNLRLEGVQARSNPMAVSVKLVTADEPYVRVILDPNYVTNVQTVLDPRSALAPPPKRAPARRVSRRAPAAAPRPGAGLPIEIGLVRINSGHMDYADLTLAPTFDVGVQTLNGTITGLSGRQDSRAIIDLAGAVDPYAPVRMNGAINFLAVRPYTDVTMSFQNMELTTFTPYSGKFAGYKVNEGKLDLALHYVIDDQKLHATHQVVINRLQLGDKVKSADATKLPVKLLVSLLKDRHGVINVPIEINGTLDDPEFRVWPVIWKVVENTCAKIVTAPFALLGSLAGHGEELQYMDFAPGSATLSPAATERVAALAKALDERPGLDLEIPMTTDPVVDRPALVDARYRSELAAEAETLAQGGGKARQRSAAPPSPRAILEALYRGQTGGAPTLPRIAPVSGRSKADSKAAADEAAIAWLEATLRARIVIGDSDLQQLGRDRAEAVQTAVLAHGDIKPSRIFLTEATPVTGATPRMRLAIR